MRNAERSVPERRSPGLSAEPDTAAEGLPLQRILDRIPADLLEPDELRAMEAVRHRLAETSLYVVALGEFKRGKSSLLNAILAADYLPIGVVPLTAVVTMIRSGPLAAVVEFQDGRREPIAADELRLYVTELGNPGNEMSLTRAELTVPSLHLPEQAVLVDTPGLGSVHEGGTEHTLAFLPHVDVALLVLSVDQTLTEAERRLAVQLQAGGTELLVAVNKADYLDEQELEQAIGFVRDSLAAVGLESIPVFAVSAKQARRGQTDGGVRALRGHLTHILERRYEAILSRQSSRRLQKLLDDLQTSYSVRGEIARRSVDQLTEALHRIEEVRVGVRQKAEDQDAIFAHKVKRIEQDVGQRAAAFQADLRAAMEAGLPELSERLREQADEHTVDALFSQTISERLAAQTAHEAATVGRELRAAADSLTSALAEVAGSLADETGAVLGVSIARPAAPQLADVAPRVDVKLRDDRVALETLAGGVQGTLPAGVRRRLLLRRARERAAELANRHAGRLRSEVVAAIRDAARDALRQAHTELDGLQQSLDQAIAHGFSQRSMGEREAVAAQRRNDEVLEGIAAARTAVDEWTQDLQLAVADANDDSPETR